MVLASAHIIVFLLVLVSIYLLRKVLPYQDQLHFCLFAYQEVTKQVQLVRQRVAEGHNSEFSSQTSTLYRKETH